MLRVASNSARNSHARYAIFRIVMHQFPLSDVIGFEQQLGVCFVQSSLG
jgi:hypothetical protein